MVIYDVPVPQELFNKAFGSSSIDVQNAQAFYGTNATIKKVTFRKCYVPSIDSDFGNPSIANYFCRIYELLEPPMDKPDLYYENKNEAIGCSDVVSYLSVVEDEIVWKDIVFNFAVPVKITEGKVYAVSFEQEISFVAQDVLGVGYGHIDISSYPDVYAPLYCNSIAAYSSYWHIYGRSTVPEYTGTHSVLNVLVEGVEDFGVVEDTHSSAISPFFTNGSYKEHASWEVGYWDDEPFSTSFGQFLHGDDKYLTKVKLRGLIKYLDCDVDFTVKCNIYENGAEITTDSFIDINGGLGTLIASSSISSVLLPFEDVAYFDEGDFVDFIFPGTLLMDSTKVYSVEFEIVRDTLGIAVCFYSLMDFYPESNGGNWLFERHDSHDHYEVYNYDDGEKALAVNIELYGTTLPPTVSSTSDNFSVSGFDNLDERHHDDNNVNVFEVNAIGFNEAEGEINPQHNEEGTASVAWTGSTSVAPSSVWTDTTS